MNNKILVKYVRRWGRGFNLYGLFVTTREQLAELNGKHVYFGEACGKHSEMEDTFDEKAFTIISEDPAVVAAMEPHCPFGNANVLGAVADQE